MVVQVSSFCQSQCSRFEDYLNRFWPRTKDMYLEKKALLKTPSEQERKLNQVPKVIPEVVKHKPTASSPSSGDDSESDEEGSADSPHHSRGKSKFAERALSELPCRT